MRRGFRQRRIAKDILLDTCACHGPKWVRRAVRGHERAAQKRAWRKEVAS